ncbi:MAG TPA: hypothetical protein VMI54_12410 [Polyangiaceae bacterium]|nr:hypothetical protein [Polyangiaceae bacterium]
MKLPSRLVSSFALSVLAVTLLGSCAEERAPINRVQPDALDKAFFVGKLDDDSDDPEFYKRGTVINVDYGASQDGLFTATYGQPLSRIRWEITEDTLNARLSYERVAGTDSTGLSVNGAGLPTTAGQIVASYAITSHFDIKRDYNPTTGEPLNIVVENTTDRPWYERQYMRVDWSKNLITDVYDYDTLAQTGIFGGVTYEPTSYTVLDPSDPDAPVFDTDAGYFDVTNKVYATPQSVDVSSLGIGVDTLPACWLDGAFQGGTAPAGNCNPVELTIRESFRKVVDTDYQAFDEDGYRFQALGSFNVERQGYDRSYGQIDTNWHRFQSRYNIWERSHFYADPANMTGPIACDTEETTETPTSDPNADPNRDVDGNGTADECEAAGPGSQCDVFTQKCTLPYMERQAVTIPWYLTGDTSYFEPTDWAVQEWDLALKTAVQTSRLTECRKVGGTNCDNMYPMWRGQEDDNEEAVAISRDFNACQRSRGWGAQSCADDAKNAAAALAATRGNENDASTLAIGDVVSMPPVLTLCHDPVIDSDHPVCGPRGLAPRLGDIRYHLVDAIENPQTPSPWGIMVDADDPLTGEKVAGSMNIWTHVTDLASQTLVDLVRYVNGELTTAQITNGQYVENFATAAKLAGAGGLPTMTKAQINERLAAATNLDVNTFAKIAAATPSDDVAALLNSTKARVLDVAASSVVASPALAKEATTLAIGRGTPVESALLNTPMLQIAGIAGTAPVGGDLLKAASPLAFNNPQMRARLAEMRENALASRGACIIDEAPEPSSLSGLADIMAKKFPPGANETPEDTSNRNTRMFDYIRRRYHYGVLAHEMGHSVGLRHNFVSSAAPLFYRPQYWQLRTKNGQVTTQCTDAVSDGSTCVGPRYYDPVTDEEQSQLIWMFMQSTVMDYPGETSQDTLGLGVTDFAAARFFYGDTTSVYADPRFNAGTAVGTGISAATDTFGGLIGIRYGVRAAGIGSTGVSEFHYSNLQKAYQLIGNCYSVSPAPPATWNADVDGNWDPVLDGHVVSIDGQPTKCREQQVDYMPYTSLRLPTTTELNNAFYRGAPSVDPSGRTRVPYAFATDTWADLGNVSVYRHDNGGDPYEMANFLITTQETRHILDNFRRDRTTFSILSAADRSFTRYNEKLMHTGAALGFLSSIYEDLATNQGYSFQTLWPQIVASQAPDNMLAATVIMDHFTRELSRPEPGQHYYRAAAFQDPVLHSASDPDDYGPTGQPILMIPNGATGYLKDVGFGGHPLENALSDSNGDFDVDYTENAGSYYDKVNVALLLAESEDRFVSQSRRDFYDARFRAVGMADIVPDAFRRAIANGLTGDRSILAPRVATDSRGNPLLDQNGNTALDPNANLYPAQSLGWPSLWPASGPEICFASLGRNACTNPLGNNSLAPIPPTNSAAVDPQIGWEVQKFLIAWTVSYIKANEKSQWLDMLRIYRDGANPDPGLGQQIEWEDPVSGEVYHASSYGEECFYGTDANCTGGKLVEKGIAARVLEYANELTAQGYVLDTANYPASDGSDGNPPHPAGYKPFGHAVVLRQPDGTPVVALDPAIRKVNEQGQLVPNVACDQNQDPTCTPLQATDNHWAYELQSYKSVPDFLWLTDSTYGLLPSPTEKGTY